jgi:hypothetical protein
MKAKKPRLTAKNRHHHEDPLPPELGTHLFAMIKRNLLARQRPEATPASQLTFAF